jgi:N-acetylglucosaminyl-diphospho-decaprenol L-rhamnosyltransferase
MNSVAAVIPSWNTAAYLERCLDSLAAQDDGVRIETIVIDNGSTDASLELMKRLDVPHVPLPANIGFACAVNLGVAKTEAPFVLVLNADCFLASDCVRLLVAGLAEDERLGGVQPRIVQHQPADEIVRICSAGQCMTRFGAEFERGWGEPDGPPYADRREIFGVSGTACLLRRELFSDLGGYDASYFAFYEDVDLNARARLAGWRFAYLPDALAMHVGHASWRQCPEAQRFNVKLSVRNRLATAVKVLPAGGVVGASLSTLRALVASPLRGTTAAVLAAMASLLRWLPRLLSERKRLRSGSTESLDAWLSRARGPGPDPGRIQGGRQTVT